MRDKNRKKTFQWSLRSLSWLIKDHLQTLAKVIFVYFKEHTGMFGKRLLLHAALLALIANTALSSNESQRIQQLLNTAENAWHKGELRQAALLFQQASHSAEESELSNQQRTAIDIRLASVARSLADLQTAQHILDSVLDQKLPENLLLPAVSLQAKVHSESGRHFQAWQVLHAMESTISSSNWPPNDRVLYYQLQETLSKSYKKTLATAEKLFEAGLHAESFPLFSDVLEASLQGAFIDTLKPDPNQVALIAKIRYRMVQAMYLSNEYQKMIDILEVPLPLTTQQRAHPEYQKIERNQLYLAGLGLRQLNQHQKAMECLTRYQRSADPAELVHLDQVYFELAMNSLALGQINKAESLLQKLLQTTDRAEIRHRCHLSLSRIDLQQKNYKKAEERLHLLTARIKEDSDLAFELSYLTAELAFCQEKWDRAASLYQKALPKRNLHLVPWANECLYHLGWSFLRATDDPLMTVSKQQELFTKAENAFQEIDNLTNLTTKEYERAILARAQCLLRKANCLSDESSFHAVTTLLQDHPRITSIDGKAGALVYRAQATSNFAKKRQLIQQLLNEELASSPFWQQGWFIQAKNTLEEIEYLDSVGRQTESDQLCRKAVDELESAYQRLRSSDPNKAALSLQYKAEVLCKTGSTKALEEALAVTETIIEKEPTLFSALPSPATIYYLRGQIASDLSEFTNDPAIQKIAEQSLVAVAANYPNSQEAPFALQHLFSLKFAKGDYVAAKHLCLKLVKDYPSSSLAGTALFWAAECADWLGEDPQSIQELRTRVYQEYADSEKAPEAYFTLFSYKDYLTGDKDAIAHLEKIAELFPHSPFRICAHYLLGLEYKRDRYTLEGALTRRANLSSAIDQFNQAKECIHLCTEENTCSNERKEYFVSVAQKALLEKGKTNMSIAECSQGAKKHIYLEYSEKCFEQLLYELENTDQNTAIESRTLCDEACFGLGTIHKYRGELTQAETVFNQMLSNFHANKEERGYLLSRVWYELAMITMEKQEFAMAEEMLERASFAGRGGILGKEMTLDLWINQALCQKALGDLDRAMSTLSQVINDDSVSPLRLQAMYLRSEIYEEQGRAELAVKQLEATAKKGSGEWAVKAQQKLEDEYGYR